MAQPHVPAPVVIERWEAQQRRALASLESLGFTETIQRDIDSPFVTRVVRLEYRATMRGGEVVRHLVLGVIDGEAVETELVERMQHRIEKALGAELALVTAAAEAPGALLRRLRPVGEPRRDRLDGGRSWRVELRAPGEESPIDRATVWFSDDLRQPRLLRSRLVLSGTEPGSVMTVVTEYAHLDGPRGEVAIGHRQSVESTIQQRRRWRTYTVLVHSERRFQEFRPAWRTP